MSTGALMMVVVLLVMVCTLAFLVFSMVRSIHNERSQKRSIWREFSLGLSLMIVFFLTWIGQGIAEWQVFTDEQRAHGESTEAGDFMSVFAQSTLENWQSEFLQLFSFVVLAALYIHKGSAESKDGEERLEAALRRIEEHLGTLPDDAPTEKADNWKLPETPMKLTGRSSGQKEREAST
jgi:succinate dehydrogenase hydrophobic anchor subunit